MSTRTASGASDLRRGAAAACLIGAGLLHGFITLEYVNEKLYIGLLFGLSVPLCIGLAAYLWQHDDRRAWLLGAALSAGMIVGFLVSRTTGLPGFNESGVWAHWTEGFPALATEIGFLVAAAPALMASIGAAQGHGQPLRG